MDPYLAQIIWFAGDFAPKGWAFCQGQLMAISTNSALFSLLGTTYGGNGINNFALPDLRGRLPLGAGAGKGLSSVDLGELGGAENTTLLTSNLPPHSHGVQVQVASSSNGGSSDEADGAILAKMTASNFAPVASANATLAGTSLTLAPAGNSQPFGNMKPFVCINAIICTSGMFPSRG